MLQLRLSGFSTIRRDRLPPLPGFCFHSLHSRGSAAAQLHHLPTFYRPLRGLKNSAGFARQLKYEFLEVPNLSINRPLGGDIVPGGTDILLCSYISLSAGEIAR